MRLAIKYLKKCYLLNSFVYLNYIAYLIIFTKTKLFKKITFKLILIKQV